VCKLGSHIQHPLYKGQGFYVNGVDDIQISSVQLKLIDGKCHPQRRISYEPGSFVSQIKDLTLKKISYNLYVVTYTAFTANTSLFYNA
jgi:hypothetical protein